MAAAKEIRTKIKSIANTQKITRAMEMVAASKMRRALERRNAARPYALKMRQVIAHIAQAHSEYRHPFMAEREAKRIGVLLVSTDRGLCGGLNTNLFRSLLREMQGWSESGLEIDACVIGNKGSMFLRRLGANVVGQGHPRRRRAAGRGSGRGGAGAARRLRGGAPRPGVHGLQRLRELDDPAAPDRADPALRLGGGGGPGRLLGLPLRAPTRPRCSTGCSSATSNRSCTRR